MAEQPEDEVVYYYDFHPTYYDILANVVSCSATPNEGELLLPTPKVHVV